MTCVLCSIDSTWLVGPCRIDFSQIRYYMAFVPCNIDYTYVESNIRIFDMTWAAKIETSVISILAAPDLSKNALKPVTFQISHALDFFSKKLAE